MSPPTPRRVYPKSGTVPLMAMARFDPAPKPTAFGETLISAPDTRGLTAPFGPGVRVSEPPDVLNGALNTMSAPDTTNTLIGVGAVTEAGNVTVPAVALPICSAPAVIEFSALKGMPAADPANFGANTTVPVPAL